MDTMTKKNREKSEVKELQRMDFTNRQVALLAAVQSIPRRGEPSTQEKTYLKWFLSEAELRAKGLLRILEEGKNEK